ncbi:hypothetical protein [Evansella halocellulosilytica]|uniref:hypothetical protein n=1 Tax=Evansella halocellulosilytica TaxID=2011013 RepID=UPI000BB70B1F|nr:hypothetical protein [Evansella halocellulosilytica]
MSFGQFMEVLVAPIDFVVNSFSYEVLIGSVFVIPAVIMIYGIVEYRKLHKENKASFNTKP